MTQTKVTVRPMDAQNERMIANAHPADWVNPQPAPSYNMVVLGGGTAGLVSAVGAAALGAHTAIVESRLYGGECLVDGCVPSKALIRAARSLAEAGRTKDFGVQLTRRPKPDFGAVMERVRRVRADISAHDSAMRLRNELGIDVFIGEGRFRGPRELAVGDTLLRFSKAIVATGSSPAQPPIEGLAQAGYLTNETLFELTELPSRLAVIGGGPIGCEMAQAFSSLGSKVTLIERRERLLLKDDAEAAEVLRRRFEAEKISMLFESTVRRVTVEDDATRLHVETSDGKRRTIDVDRILVGAGRVPVVENIGLEAAGIQYDTKNGVQVDDYLRTTNPDVYAAGDVCLKKRFTHTADAAARAAVQNALFPLRKRFSSYVVPWCTYTEPEIAHTGMYPSDAVRDGIEVERMVQPFGDIDRAVIDGEEDGMLIVYLKRGTDRLVGATLVATHAGEMITELTLAISSGSGLRELGSIIHPYPTQVEAVRRLADTYNRRRLTPAVSTLLSYWFRWAR
ncbi:MAG: FAD-containing oxidoreductase [Chitinivibrionales bacterium]|nr:FAD-containing oxidoreductase [Chitinivibrionales bacterium]